MGISVQDPTENVKNLKVGTEDPLDYNVVNIFSKRTQFVIYEVNDKSIENRIRIIMDSNDQAREAQIVKKYNYVKDKYIKAKSVLLHSENYDENKSLITHTLAAYLDDPDDFSDDGNKFDRIVDNIYLKNKNILLNKFFLLLPFIFLLLISGYFLPHHQNDLIKEEYLWHIPLIAFATILSSLASISISLKERNFQMFNGVWLYFLVGIKKLVLSLATSGIFIIVLKSEIVSVKLFEPNNLWGIMMACILAGFSERLIPDLLSHSEPMVKIKER